MLQEAIKISSQGGIQSRDTTANLVRANTYISGYAMHNSVGIIVCSAQALHTSPMCICSTIGKHTLTYNSEH